LLWLQFSAVVIFTYICNFLHQGWHSRRLPRPYITTYPYAIIAVSSIIILVINDVSGWSRGESIVESTSMNRSGAPAEILSPICVVSETHTLTVGAKKIVLATKGYFYFILSEAALSFWQ